MSLMRRMAVFVAITLPMGLSAERPQSRDKPKIEDSFKISCSSVTYSKTVLVRNTAVSGRQGQVASEKLSLSCDVEILDTHRVLGICRESIIEEVTNGSGKSVKTGSMSHGSGDMKYDLLRYRKRYVRTNPKLINAVRSMLGLPRKSTSRPYWVKELESHLMQINLDAGLIQQPGEEIGRVKGYFYALAAESIAYVDVPFERMEGWVRLTNDTEIQLGDVWCEESKYKLRIRARPEAKESAPPLTVQTYLPDRLLVARQVLGPDDKPILHPAGIRCLPDSLTDEAEVYAGSGIDRTKKIRFVIAVKPTHHKIPFVLEDIPLPRP